jgi:tetraprenyl-beta-curcumene synthase
MTANTRVRRTSLATIFLKAAGHYWLSVFPRIRRESQHWRQRAEAIPDPMLRHLALEAQEIKRGNIEGSAAFAAFAPRPHRAATVRAQVAFQSAYDYVDTLAEQPNSHPIANGRQLHQALLDAINQDHERCDYYARHTHDKDDGGYLEQIIDACRSALLTLPSRASIALPANRLAEHIVAYQSLNLSQPQGGHRHLEQWALKATPPGTGLRWWETAASAGSSLGLFALITAAARPALPPTDADAIEDAYWPWIGALHSLLDSLIDKPQDAAVSQQCLLDYYTTPQEAAARMQILAREALRAAASLPKPQDHTLILAAMASYYLTAPEASSPTTQLISQRVLETLGPITRPSMALHAARSAAGSIGLPRRRIGSNRSRSGAGSTHRTSKPH